jgi:acyl-[acyl-carrier-protein]-phospholipid O-acyltransferase/long-chain-fatty-acid--[acyl-carrier-protein] ligase
VVGAEKLRDPLRVEFREAFGIELLEGYGCTELSPVVSVNTPDFREGKEVQIGNRPGTVGIPLPGVSACVVDPDTRERLPVGEPGMLLVRGPNRMVGYLNQPEKTAEVFHGPWYITGDIAAIDEDGFIKITDRLSRFSKIGGEMVPHLRIACAVTGIPDDRKGERLALLYTATGITPEEVWRKLSDTDLPKLWIPKQDLIRQVEALPVLGSGKLDLRSVKARALEFAEAT